LQSQRNGERAGATAYVDQMTDTVESARSHGDEIHGQIPTMLGEQLLTAAELVGLAQVSQPVAGAARERGIPPDALSFQKLRRQRCMKRPVQRRPEVIPRTSIEELTRHGGEPKRVIRAVHESQAAQDAQYGVGAAFSQSRSSDDVRSRDRLRTRHGGEQLQVVRPP
jgi:hypothetical protein